MGEKQTVLTELGTAALHMLHGSIDARELRFTGQGIQNTNLTLGLFAHLEIEKRCGSRMSASLKGGP
jgi:hypothetical protein